MKNKIAFVDCEIGTDNKKIYDMGAVLDDGNTFHSSSVRDFFEFIKNTKYLCGHNIIHHDLKYLYTQTNKRIKAQEIDTLYLSPLFFPEKIYHSLLKDDKLQSEELNNPLNDARKAEQLFYSEVNAFNNLPHSLKQIFYELLHNRKEFSGFFNFISFYSAPYTVESVIKREFKGRICENTDIRFWAKNYPVELAYALALIGANDYVSVTPPWLAKNFPEIENIIKKLRNTPCEKKCLYCREKMDVRIGLKKYFGYDNFRTYNGEPLQEKAAEAAMFGKSLLAVFPTGGGKSITFQLPALMSGDSTHGLTVVISPLQSLMKDQVDNLYQQGILNATTVNGLLSPVELADAYERILNGEVSILYISPEKLRSRTIEKMLLSRNVTRFVIDEAHCFSAWGQDFRVDYLYIGDFIKKLQEKKKLKESIPVSCFTATAKQKVISDICDYFKEKLNLQLEMYASSATRENLHYAVIYKETEEEKYNQLRFLIEQKKCPTIVYVSRTKKTEQLAAKLSQDGFPAKPFNGKMEAKDKIANQESFISNEIDVIVATSAFGMGVDKKDVKLVIHYDISDSLENYVQEAGRAGRDPSLQADCYVLYNDKDLDKHFIMLNQTKLSISEIQQVWKSIKDLTKQRTMISCSALEIARQAGWDNSIFEVETRIKTAIAALETAGYIRRDYNVPHIYATSINAKNMQEAAVRIDDSRLFSDADKVKAKRIIKSLISSRSIAKAGNDEAESRVDYLADMLGMTKDEVISTVDLMREDGLLADTKDMSAYILKNDTQNKSKQILDRFIKLEKYIYEFFSVDGLEINLKELNGNAINAGINHASVKNIRTVLYYLTLKNVILKDEYSSNSVMRITPMIERAILEEKLENRIDICYFILDELYRKATEEKQKGVEAEEILVSFSLVGLYQEYKAVPRMEWDKKEITLRDVEDALLYLSKIGSLKLEGGFLVLYNGMQITRLVTDNRIKYKLEDYRVLDEFYKQKIRQIHIVGEYANLMVRDLDKALQFVQDYFQMDFKLFISKYFKGERIEEINRNITPQKYRQLFGELSKKQKEIIDDNESRYIVAVAGPGSGKTKLLVHKMASLLLTEDVKHEQLLMLTFSRAAANEFKKRLIELIGNAAYHVEIKTFHSYCFDLLGKIGSLDGVGNVIQEAVEKINSGEVEQGKIAKTVLLIDEAQDMDRDDYSLIQALIHNNDEMRVIAVGDDDQNIFQFRQSDSKYFHSLVENEGAKKYELIENYRSKKNIINFANSFLKEMKNRIKVNPLIAVQEEDGIVELVYHTSDNIEEAVVNQLLETYKGGNAGVLTETNIEAASIVGMLLKIGLRAKLIETDEKIKLFNLYEVRYFLYHIRRTSNEPTISDEIWKNELKRFKVMFNNSSCYRNCLMLFEEFAHLNKVKYKSDFEEYIKESKYENYYSDDKETIYVSTIHKAKGREFDNVYIMLSSSSKMTEEYKRKIYVGITRAKKALFVHYNNELFSRVQAENIIKKADNKNYTESKEICLQLSYSDVFLDYFIERQSDILKLRSGMELFIK